MNCDDANIYTFISNKGFKLVEKRRDYLQLLFGKPIPENEIVVNSQIRAYHVAGWFK